MAINKNVACIGMSFGWCMHLQAWCLNVGLLRWNDLCSSQDFYNNFATFNMFVQTAFSKSWMSCLFLLTTFLTVFFGRLHVVMIPSYKTPVEVLRMALHARDLGRLKIWQLGNLPKKTTLSKSLWNKLNVVKLCNTCISHWIWFWTWWRTWGVYCFTAVFLTWSLFSDEISPRVDSQFVHCCSVQPLRGSDELQTLQDLFSMSFGSVFVSVFEDTKIINILHWWPGGELGGVELPGRIWAFALPLKSGSKKLKPRPGFCFFGCELLWFFWVDSGVDEGRNLKNNSIKVREKWKKQHLFQHSECI